jgi:hypothetical protein
VITKRQLGMVATATGLLAVVGVVAVDVVGAGQWSGVGPLQRLGIAAGLVFVGVGLLLMRLGDRPA